MSKFKLSEQFLDKYKKIEPPFGFGGLGKIIYLRTYSRVRENGENEQWHETIARVVEGTFNMQKDHIEAHNLGWNPHKAQYAAQDMYDRMFNMKFLPPGRGLWAMGSAITEERKLFAALNNCCFRSTENIKDDPSDPFCFVMDASMLGIGVGFDVKGAEKINVKGVNKRLKKQVFQIPDTREGWVESVKILLDSYFYGLNDWEFDYSLIRKAGEIIKGFGGISGGPDPLITLHKQIRKVLDKNEDRPITVRAIADIMNMIGVCVVSGNVRRSALINLGDYRSEEYLDLKDYSINPEREEYGWTSNNSVFCELGMDYSIPASRTKVNGEPGYFWLDNTQKYSKLSEGIDNKDHRVLGVNPCGEQPLESGEMCNLVETFPFNHETLEDYLATLKQAYLYAKTVTLGQTHWPATNRIMLRNRRIGCSMSGIAQFVAKRGLHEFKRWCEEGYKKIEYYDEVYSDWLAIPKSIKKTSIKPSGTVSLLAGATAGMHWPESNYYIRRFRLSNTSTMVEPLKKAGYHVEPDTKEPDSTMVVEVPVYVEGVRTVSQVSMWEQLSMAAFLQKYWADNQVSCTVTFKPEEGDQIKEALNYFQYQLKGISFLPKTEKGAYPQMPYEEITKEKYEELTKGIKTPNFKKIKNELADVERFCTNDTCELKAKSVDKPQ